MKHLLLEEFGTTIDWIVVVIISILLVIIALFLFAFLYFIFKNSNKENKDDDNMKIDIPKNKIQVFLDNQNNSMPTGHTKCRYCGKEVKNLSGKCNTCGKYNFDFNPKKSKNENSNKQSKTNNKKMS